MCTNIIVHNQHKVLILISGKFDFVHAFSVKSFEVPLVKFTDTCMLSITLVHLRFWNVH